VKTAPTLIAVSFCVLTNAAWSQEACLVLDTHCVELREYLLSQPSSASIKDVTDRVGDILVANYFPDYPDSDKMVCVPNSTLSQLLQGNEYDLIRTEFEFPPSVVPSLVEYALNNGRRYCYLDQGNS
jgi:hypothetical protein